MIAAAWLLANTFNLHGSSTRLSLSNGFIACIAAIGLLYGVRTVMRNPAWESDFTLNKAGAEDAPRCIGTKIEYARLCLLKTSTTANPAERQQLMQTAYTQLHEAIALDPNAMAAAYSWMANYFTSYNLKYDSAVYYATRAAQVEPEFRAFHYNEYVSRGDSAASVKNYVRAEQMYRKMLDFPELQPDVAYLKLGIVAALQKNYDTSLPYLQKALQLNPNNAAARNNFLYVQQQRQRVADSLKALNR
jgi:tetratricopeptide (TPR) repeat protein